jgi:acyl-CoA synthetase (AMP-forming)/AMP-acid ligase II
MARGDDEGSIEVAASFNIGSVLPDRAAEHPHRRAIVVPEGYNDLGMRTYSHLSFAELDTMCDDFAVGLGELGVGRGDRVLVMVRQGYELIALVFALFKMGAIPVMIDPGMGRAEFLECVAHTMPDALVGVPLAHALAGVFSRPFETVRHRVLTRPVFWSDAPALVDMLGSSRRRFEPVDTGRDELAAILFTSGSTGPAKGVHYTHGIFGSQVRAIGEMYGIESGDIEVPAFPLFSLFSVGLGVTCVLPDMDPSKPAEVDPRLFVEAIRDHGANAAFGSPSIWVRVASYCLEEEIRLPTLDRILTAGAPIPPSLMEAYRDILRADAHLHTPYGATESLPVATISSEEVLAETAEASRRGAGICVGHLAPGIEVRIVELRDDVIPTMADAVELGPGEVGEICVYGPQVTPAYDGLPGETRRAKIPDPPRGEGAFWHRMGDAGYLDEEGRLWFCGRTSQRVETAEGTKFTVPCEMIFDAHPQVARSALVGLGERGAQVPAIVVEPLEGAFPETAEARELFRTELEALAQGAEHTAEIEIFAFHPDFPVDRRHNSKIHRGELAEWLGRALR